MPEGFSYCGKCGARLGTAPLLSRESRERSLLENDIAGTVADSLIKWAKLAGGIWLAAATVTLLSISIWGYGSLSGIKTNLERIARETNARAESIKTQVNSASSTVAGLDQRYKELSGDLDHYREVNRSIERLQNDLRTVNGQIASWYESLQSEVIDSSASGRVKFTPLTPDEINKLKSKYPAPGAISDTLFRADITLKKRFVRKNRGWFPAPAVWQVSDRARVRGLGTFGSHRLFSW